MKMLARSGRAADWGEGRREQVRAFWRSARERFGGPAPPDVGEHGVECEEVSMDVGNRGNSHTLIDFLEMPALLELVFQFPHQGLQ